MPRRLVVWFVCILKQKSALGTDPVGTKSNSVLASVRARDGLARCLGAHRLEGRTFWSRGTVVLEESGVLAFESRHDERVKCA